MPPRVFGLRQAPDEMVICIYPKEEQEQEHESEDDTVETGFQRPQTGRPSTRLVMQSRVTGIKCDNCYFYSCPCLNCGPRQEDYDLTRMTYEEFRGNRIDVYPADYLDFVYAEDVLQGWITVPEQDDSSGREKQA
jgi:hypothetical protein